MKVSYMIIDTASWEPSYDVRISSETADVIEMTYYGSVRQWSREDWMHAKLTLSTANPANGAQPPELGTLHVRFGPGSSPHSYSSSSSSLSSPPSLLSSSPLPPSDGKSGVASTTFGIPRLTTIHSDNRPHKVPHPPLLLCTLHHLTLSPLLYPLPSTLYPLPPRIEDPHHFHPTQS